MVQQKNLRQCKLPLESDRSIALTSISCMQDATCMSYMQDIYEPGNWFPEGQHPCDFIDARYS